MYQISLEAARVNANMTQQQAADQLRINVSTLRNWEAGRTAPDARCFKELCDLYKCPIELIFLPNRLTKSESNPCEEVNR